MSHDMSLMCYMRAKKDPSISPDHYADLEKVLGIFGLGESLRASPQELERPDRFSFHHRAPTLLVVEDDPGIAEILVERLVDWGYPEEAICVLLSGEEAIRYVQDHAIGIAFLDINLSNPAEAQGIYTSGLQVLRALKGTSPGAKVILFSGHATYEMVRQSILELGASYFLSKPHPLADILHIVHWALGRVLGTEVKEIITSGSASQPGARSMEQVLVVDDDESLAEGIAMALDQLGYRASWVGSGKSALYELSKYRFDAVLLDIKMPDMDGLEVLSQILSKNKEVVVIMLTAVRDEQIAQKAVALGASNFLVKPCDISLLHLTLEYAFAQHQ